MRVPGAAPALIHSSHTGHTLSVVRLSPTPWRLLLPMGCALVLVLAGGAAGIQKPGRTFVRPGEVRLVALNGASLAFVVARTKTDCDHVELWNTDTRGTWRFGRAGACTNLGSTGAGITSLGVSGKRVAWVRFNGGNLRDWQLMTATTTQRLPRQLRFVEQDVDLPAPMVVGDSTASLGIPYASGNEVVLLGANGVAVFKHTDPAQIVAVTAGLGPAGAVVAALRETGEVVMLRSDGSVAWTVAYPPGAVTSIALAPAGLVAQTAGSVQIRTPTRSSAVALPAGAAMVDYAAGRILYTLNGNVHARRASNGADTLLLRGSGTAHPVVATNDTHGLAWGRGRSVNFACAACLRFSG